MVVCPKTPHRLFYLFIKFGKREGGGNVFFALVFDLRPFVIICRNTLSLPIWSFVSRRDLDLPSRSASSYDLHLRHFLRSYLPQGSKEERGSREEAFPPTDDLLWPKPGRAPLRAAGPARPRAAVPHAATPCAWLRAPTSCWPRKLLRPAPPPRLLFRTQFDLLRNAAALPLLQLTPPTCHRLREPRQRRCPAAPVMSRTV